MTTKSITLRILWGKTPDPDQVPDVYHFDTEAERDAFIEGAVAALGWEDFHTV